ncbi:hypothetical protein Fmac_025957 [Flemingia macrophylla]|uniref:Alpha/beta hydrolase fold-3 domain-containing protein n=1 Tax=Flemingia macrophylla TaxID=520843 RepID=A0ABD1LDR5_9FABA
MPLYFPGIHPKTNVQFKDVTTDTTARLYLPPAADKGSKLPLLIYIHDDAFCVCTPFNPAYHNHLNAVSAAANVVVVSVVTQSLHRIVTSLSFRWKMRNKERRAARGSQLNRRFIWCHAQIPSLSPYQQITKPA